jgi:DNA-binding response OmpR family regulator
MAKILIIEDHRILRDWLQDVLTFKGYDVVSAHSGRGGLELRARYRPDLVITDISLPDISGLEVVRRLRPPPGPRAKIIVMSDWDLPDPEHVTALGFDRALRKPFSVNELIAAVRQLLGEPPLA